jgi:hypothetical protein
MRPASEECCAQILHSAQPGRCERRTGSTAEAHTPLRSTVRRRKVRTFLFLTSALLGQGRARCTRTSCRGAWATTRRLRTSKRRWTPSARYVGAPGTRCAQHTRGYSAQPAHLLLLQATVACAKLLVQYEACQSRIEEKARATGPFVLTEPLPWVLPALAVRHMRTFQRIHARVSRVCVCSPDQDAPRPEQGSGNCGGQYADFVGCVDGCVAKSLFSKLK